MNNVERSQDALQLEALLASRAYLFMMFHKLFGGTLNRELLTTLLDDMTLDVVDEYVDGNATMSGFFGFLSSLREKDFEELFDGARDEYTRIFIGPAALPASPYESPYTGNHDMALFQENTIAVRSLYRSQGLELARVQSVPDDHVSIQCAFMAELAERALEMFRAGKFSEAVESLRFQAAFAENHMANWLGAYAKAVRNSKAARSAILFPQLIEALAAFAGVDAAFAKESSFWMESSECPESGIGASPELQGVDAARAELSAIELFGIRDNQLVPLNQ